MYSFSNIVKSKWMFAYTIFSGMIALCIFVYGYIPVFLLSTNSASYQDVPVTIDGFSVDPKCAYDSHVRKLALIVVDSLSMEFLTDKTKLQNLPHILRLINNGNACLVPCNMPPPTTTMRTIKTLATGTISSFVETILTFDVQELQMDSIFRQAKENKLLLSLHGSEIWTKLFPEYFHRGETIDASKILKYPEVDANMTKTMVMEMDKNDWNWLLFHYMGLKHFAFDRYSNSKQLGIKLQELDRAVEFAHRKLAAQTNDYMILIIGDTGIGNSEEPSESYKNPRTIAPCIIIGRPCSHYHPSKFMDQIDLAPTLAVLTGLPIPASSYGSLNTVVLLNFLSDDQLLYALYYNTARLVNLTLRMNIRRTEDPAHRLFQNAVVQHGRYLQSIEKSDNHLQLHDTISTMYIRTAENLSKRINDFLNTSDVSIQYLAFVLVIEVMVILVNQSEERSANKRLNFLVISITNLLILTWVLSTGISKRGTSFIHMTHAKGFVITTVVVLMLCNSYIMASQRSFLTRLISVSTSLMERYKVEIRTVSSRIDSATSNNKREKMSSSMVLLVLGTILHAFSLLELSYIKWEKSVWFFLWTSMGFFIIYNQIGKLFPKGTPTNNHDFLSKQRNADAGIIAVAVSILIMHRTIMTYTTVEYWLSHGNNHICASMCLMFGLVLLLFTCNIFYEPFTSAADKIITRLLVALVCCSIYMTNIARGNVNLPYYPKSDGGLEMILFWFTWTSIVGYGLGFCIIGTCYKGLSSARQLIATAITCWACFSALLSHPHKVLLIPIEMLFGQVMSDVFKNHNQCLVLSHIWLGHLFFHYQGYTYSLNSVDITARLLYSKHICSPIFGVHLVVNTFSAPVLSYLICVHGILDNNLKKRASQGISETNLTFGYCRFLLMSVYLLGMLVHRHNEWFWSILCPKLLYEIIYTFFICITMVVVQITGVFHDLSLKLRIPFTEPL